MLEVQKYLQTHTLDELKNEFGIRSNRHEDGRVILNYHQIDSDCFKTHPIVRECRGLVLFENSKNNWGLVARSFPRFFNLGEVPEDDAKFDWNSCVLTDKEDGSLIIVYRWNGKIQVNTRNSFGQDKINGLNITWHDLVTSLLPQLNLYQGYSLVFELCSRYNKVIRDYPKPKLYFITGFIDGVEIPDGFLDISFSIRKLYSIYGRPITDSETNNLVKEYSKEDKTYEGFVAIDKNFNRIKIKSPEYVKLHRLKNNGAINNTDSIVDIILSGETAEILSYFPELEDSINNTAKLITKISDEVSDLWYEYKDLDIKDFAITIQSKTRYTAPLFSAKRRGGHPTEHIGKEWIVKQLKN